MRIGIVTTWFERGAAIVSRAYMQTLSHSHDVFIYARGGEQYAIGDAKWDREYVTWGKRVPDHPPTYVDWADFQRWVSGSGLEVVIFNEQHSWEVILKSVKLDAVMGAYVDYYTADTVPFFGLYDFLLCNTKCHYSVFSTHPRAVYIPWGTDCDLFRPTTSSTAPETVTFFHSAGMGGAGLRKGTDILVRAFQKVSGNTRLIIHSQVGIETYAVVAELIENDGRVTFIEGTFEAPGLYHLGDVYVYPTRLEGIGLTIAEALASGLPVITTNCAPMNEFVQDNVTGKLVDVERYEDRPDGYYWPQRICSESALAEAMQFYVDNRADLEEQKRLARAYALAHLDWKKNSADLPTLIEGFSRIGSKPRALGSAVARYERARLAQTHIEASFRAHKAGDRAAVRAQLTRALIRAPGWLRNRGVLSILLQALLGFNPAHVVRQALRRTIQKGWDHAHG